jgi:hypothetical protein
MTTYFASQGGEGLYDGTNPANAWGVSSIPWASLNPNDTLFLLDTITSTITITKDFGKSGSLIIRGDYRGKECRMDGSGTLTRLIQVSEEGYSGYTFRGIGFWDVHDATTSCAIFLNATNNVTIYECHLENATLSSARGVIMKTGPLIGIENLSILENTWVDLELGIQLEINTTSPTGLCRNIEIEGNSSTGINFVEFVISNPQTHSARLYPTGFKTLFYFH